MSEGTQQKSPSLKNALKAGLRSDQSNAGSAPEPLGWSSPGKSSSEPSRNDQFQSAFERFDALMGLNAPEDGTSARREDPVGFIAALHESRIKPDAIGYDRQGGTSYGIYQIASRAGTFDGFLSYLDKTKPEWAKRLREAGEPNTGSRVGRVPEEWKKIASEDPEGFAREQRRFILQSHYDPAMREIRKYTNHDLKEASRAVKEAVFSTSVQHGPRGAGRLFGRGFKKLEDTHAQITDANLIDSVYEARKDQFRSSTQPVQDAVRRRLDEEKREVMRTMNADILSPAMDFKP